MSTNTFARVCLALTVVTAAHGQGRDYGRSMVISQQGIAATSQVLASQAGAGNLAKGGSAADAAIASNSLIQINAPFCATGDHIHIY